MALEAGAKLGPYEIISPLGAGGMGEVYKAKDTRLDRTVAIKVLPSHLSDNTRLKERFEREARAVSSLNHPHICTLHDIGSENGVDFMVMEHIEGETLADCLKKGPLPLDQALRYAIEIADALDKAHRQGVVHRDLKPGNIMLTKSGAKLLDFGLATRLRQGFGEAGTRGSSLPTEQKPLTEEGSILGTFQYMAPEQLEGKEADSRTDIFAFGAVLYEMVTGRRAFEGKSQASLIGAIMTSEPPAMSLQTMTPPLLDHVVRRCLVKEPDGRWQSAADVMGELSWIADGGSEVGASVPKPAGRQLSIGSAVAVALLLSGVVAAAVWSLKPEPARRLLRVVASPPSAEPLVVGAPDVDLAVTPDGTRIVYVTTLNGQRQLVVRSLDQLEATLLTGPGRLSRGPFISPDGNWVGYFEGSSALRKVSIHGGPPIDICDVPGAQPPRGASWGPDDTIIFAVGGMSSGLLRVPSGGGEPEKLTTPDAAQGDHQWPEILPGGEGVLFTIIGGSVENAQIAALSLVTGEIKVLIPGGSNPRYVPTGHIVYGVGGTLRAVAFDIERLEVTSDPIPVLEGVITKEGGAAEFAISGDGSLVYIAGDQQSGQVRTLVWVDRDGQEEVLAAEPRQYTYPRISPDGSQVALDVRDQESDIWIWDFARETLRRFTFDPSFDQYPTWTPDGRRLAFSSARSGSPNLFWKAADGTGTVERLTESEDGQAPHVFSPDGKQLLYRHRDFEGGDDIGVRTMDGDGSVEPLLASAFVERNGEISPDGEWLAYQSDASGQDEIYVRPFPNVDEGLEQLSRGGGTRPLWSRDGTELFYLNPSGQLMAVSVRLNPSFDFGDPQVVLEGSYYFTAQGRTYDVSPDGERFLMIKEGAGEETPPMELILVQNWFDELKRLVPID